MADITDRKLKGEIDRREHLREEYPPVGPITKPSVKMFTITTPRKPPKKLGGGGYENSIEGTKKMTYHPAAQAKNANAPDAICRFADAVAFPIALCQ